MGGADIPCIMHKSAAEWRSCAHAAESRLADGRIGPLQWHSTLGYSDPTPWGNIQRLEGPGHAFNVIAGPTIGAMLARMGAEVIKIDPVSPFYGPGVTVLYGIVANIGKQSLLLNVSRPDGREFLNTLIRDSDVIIINSTPRSLERIGMTHAGASAKINPRILLTRFDAWGGPAEAGVCQFCRLRRQYSSGNRHHGTVRRGLDTRRRKMPTSEPSMSSPALRAPLQR